MAKKHICISDAMKKRLDELKEGNETYQEVINRFMSANFWNSRDNELLKRKRCR